MWPWRRENRATDYSSLLLQLLESSAAGESVQAGVAAVEVCAGLFSRAMATARVEPENERTRSLTPSIMAVVGRSLIVPGECVLELEVDEGVLRLRPASSWAITGGTARSSWLYQVSRNGPSGMEMITLPASAVAHIQLGFDPARPWVGMGPLANANTSTALGAMIEQRLYEETSARVGNLLPVPDPENQRLKSILDGLKGKNALVESTSDNWTLGGPGPRNDYLPRRLGANPPSSLIDLRSQVSETILAACGVPVALLGRSDGTLLRESLRQLVHGTIEPAGRIVAEEIGDKIEEPDLRFDFTALRAADVTGRARAMASMVSAGLSVDDAGRIAGLFDNDD